jgi:hypothetical protein
MTQLNRRTIRLVAAAASAGMAVIYYLIGFGVLSVVRGGSVDVDILVFGLAAGSAFALGAILLLFFDHRILWIGGALLQLFVVWGYIAVAPDRTPAFELWGITLRIIQVPLFAALVYLALQAPQPRHAPVRPKSHRR